MTVPDWVGSSGPSLRTHKVPLLTLPSMFVQKTESRTSPFGKWCVDSDGFVSFAISREACLVASLSLRTSDPGSEYGNFRPPGSHLAEGIDTTSESASES